MLRIRKTSTRGIVREFRLGQVQAPDWRHHAWQLPRLSLADPAPGHSGFAICCRTGSTAQRHEPPRRGLRRGAYPGNSHNVAALIKDFTKRAPAPAPQATRSTRTNTAKELADWAHRDARTIKPREVIELGRDWSTALPGDGHRVAGLLSQCSGTASTTGCRILAGACVFRREATERPRQRALDDEELATLLANVDEVTNERSARASRSG